MPPIDAEGITVQIINQTPIVVNVGQAGPPGANGVPGAGANSTGTAGAAISGGTMVADVGGQLFPADCTNSAHFGQVVGMAINSASLNAPVTYQTAGPVPGNSGLVAGQQYFIGQTGHIVSATAFNAITGAAWQQSCGIAQDTTVFIVVPSDPVELN